MRARTLQALLLLALLLVGPARAGLRITSVEAVDDPIAADTQSTRIIVLGEADCTSVLLRRQPPNMGGIRMLVDWTAQDMVVTGAPERLIDPVGCGPTATTIPINVTLDAAVLGAAPAMVPQPGTVSWTFEPSQFDEQDPAEGNGTFSLRALPRVSPEALFGERQATVRDVPLAFTVTVANRGNVAFEATGLGVLAGVHGDPEVTANVAVSSTVVERGQSAELTVTVDVPLGGRWTNAHVLGNLTFTSTVDPVGTPRVVPFDFFLTHKDAHRRESPAPPASLLLLALAVLVARRR